MSEGEALLELARNYGAIGVAGCLLIVSIYRVAQFLKGPITAVSERFITLMIGLTAEIEKNNVHKERLLNVLTKHKDALDEILKIVRYSRARLDRDEDEGD